MERKEFLTLIGAGSASVFATLCLSSCSKSSTSNGEVTPPSNVDISLDLSLPANSNLSAAGGFMYTRGIIVAHTLAGNYIAVSQACTHEGVTVQYIPANQKFYCPSHGATFSETGAVTGGPASTALRQYQTALSGTMLRIYS